MRRIALWCLLSVILAGCSGSSSTAPTTDNATQSDATVATQLPTGEQMLGLWRLTVDGQALHASVEQATLEQSPARSAMVGTQGRYYDVDISRFVTPDMLRATAVRFDINGDLLIDLQHRHPFRAPDFTRPITAGNRADLGYTGKLLVLADSVHTEFATQNLTADPTLVRNPDGYAATGDLLFATGITNNLFPYLLLVDEAKDNRIGQSNEGDVHGNYDAATGGWQRGNAGTDGAGWTGYDFLHGGQSVTTTLAIPRANIVGSTVSVELAVLVKYTDPRGVGDIDHRFPFEPADALQFAYRLPHAAWDVGRCQTCDAPTLGTDVGIDVVVQVRDWDQGASMAGDDDLSDESDVALVLPGALSAPTLKLDLTQLAPATIDFTRESGTGLPDDEYVYRAQIPAPGAVAAGTYYGLVIATDPESTAVAEPEVHAGVDPITLAPSAARRLPLSSYNIVPITLTGHRAWAVHIPKGLSSPGEVVVGPDGTIVLVYEEYNAGSDVLPGPCVDWEDSFGNSDVALAWYDQDGRFIRKHRLGTDGIERALGGAMDSTGSLLITGYTATAGMDWDPGAGVATVSGADLLAIVAKYGPDGSFEWIQGYGQTLGGGYVHGFRVAVDSTDAALVVGDIYGSSLDMDPGPGTVYMGTGNQYDGYVSKFASDGAYQWTRSWSNDGSDTAFAVGAASDDDVLVAGAVDGTTIDLDPTAGSDPYTGADDAFIARLSPTGSYRWGRAFGGASTDTAFDVKAQSTGNIVATGNWRGTVDFDPGAGTDSRTAAGLAGDLFITQFTGTGSYIEADTWSGSGNDLMGQMSLTPDGSIYLTGSFTGTIDFDPGPGDATLTALDFFGDGFVLRLNDDLSLDWVDPIAGPGFSVGLCLGTALDGSALVGMSLSQGDDLHPGAPVVPVPFSAISLVRYPADGVW